MPTASPPNPEELILSMLRDVLARQARQMGLAAEGDRPPPPAPAPPRPAPPPAARSARGPEAEILDDGRDEPLTSAEMAELAEYAKLAVQPITPAGLRRALRWLAGALAIILVLVNLPLLNGTAIIRALGDPQNIVLSEGRLLREENDSAIYVMQNNLRRLISSEEAFQHYGYRWGNVTVVPPGYLEGVPEGAPQHVLITCRGQAEIYLLDGSRRRPIRDFAVVEAMGYTLDRDLRYVSCERLREYLVGTLIP